MLGRTEIVLLENVVYLASIDSYTTIHMESGAKLVSSKPLKNYIEMLDSHRSFLRVHRSYVINKNKAIRLIRDSAQHKYAVVMCNNDEVPISYNTREAIIKKMLE